MTSKPGARTLDVPSFLSYAAADALATARVHSALEDSGWDLWGDNSLHFYPECIDSFGDFTEAIQIRAAIALADIERRGIELRDSGSAPSTLANYKKSIKAFTSWAYDTDRLPGDPLRKLEGFELEEEEESPRRALDGDTLRRLIQATMSSEVWRGCSGRERALLYATASNMGIRWDECRKLVRRDFSLEGSRPTLNVRGTVSKNKRRAILPIPLGVAHELAAFFADHPALPSAPAFPKQPKGNVGALMMRKDLGVIGVPYETDDGRADFHALRHTFITNLQLAGVPVAQARILARHSSVQLTAARYFHTTAEMDATAVASLPVVFGASNLRTGTDDLPFEMTSEKRARFRAFLEAIPVKRCQRVAI